MSFDNDFFPLTYFIRLYTSSSAISLPSLLYVVSTNTRTFGSILNRASDLWSWVWAGSDGDLFSVWQWINGIGFVSRCINLHRIRKKEKRERKNLWLLLFIVFSLLSRVFLSCLKWFSLFVRLAFQYVFMAVDSSQSPFVGEDYINLVTLWCWGS